MKRVRERPESRFVACARCFAALALLSRGYAASTEPPRALTDARSISALSADQARRQYPVAIRGVVTYADMELGHMFLQDQSAATFVYFDPAVRAPAMREGQLVEVRGVTTPGDFSSCVRGSAFRVVGEAPLPRPLRLPYEKLFTGRWACYWAQVEGTIRSGKKEAGRLILDLATDDNKILVVMPPFAKWENTLIGSKVSLRGPMSALYNNRRQARGVKLFVPGPRYVAVLKPAPADAYALPAISPSTIGQYNIASDLEAQVHLRGTVTAIEPGPRVFVSDRETTVAMESYPQCKPRPGTLIDAVGFRGTVNGRAGLVDATCRAAGPGETIAPQWASASDILSIQGEPSGDPTVFLHNNTRFDLRLVVTEGVLLQASPGPAGLTLLLGSRNKEFTATLPKISGAVSGAPEIGSELRLTGLCILTYDAYGRPVSFRLALRDSGDVKTLTTPPWWTAERLWILLSVVLGAAIVAFGWTGLLRRHVRSQTATIRTQMRDLEALKQRAEAANVLLLELSHQDPLTRVSNRRRFDEALAMEMRRAGRGPLSLIMADLDHFKALNDLYGHQRGDESLVQVAGVLREWASRGSDVVARYGGEEFAMILPETDRVSAMEVAESIVAAVTELGIEHEGNPGVGRVSISLGVTTIGREAEATAEEVIQAVDRALYEAKAGGRNRAGFGTMKERSAILPSRERVAV